MVGLSAVFVPGEESRGRAGGPGEAGESAPREPSSGGTLRRWKRLLEALPRRSQSSVPPGRAAAVNPGAVQM